MDNIWYMLPHFQYATKKKLVYHAIVTRKQWCRNIGLPWLINQSLPGNVLINSAAGCWHVRVNCTSSTPFCFPQKERERERADITPQRPPLSLFNYLREAPFSKFALLLTSLLSASDAFTLIRFLTASTISISSVPMSPWDRIFSLRLSDWTQSSTHQR